MSQNEAINILATIAVALAVLAAPFGDPLAGGKPIYRKYLLIAAAIFALPPLVKLWLAAILGA